MCFHNKMLQDKQKQEPAPQLFVFAVPAVVDGYCNPKWSEFSSGRRHLFETASSIIPVACSTGSGGITVIPATKRVNLK
jgi:hypothetical protein